MSDIQLGPFIVDTSNSRILRDDVEVKLRPQAFRTLRVLLGERHHR